MTEKLSIKNVWESFKNSRKIQIITASVVAVIILACIFIPKYKFISFKSAVADGDLYRAAEIYNKSFKKLQDQAWAENILLADIDNRFSKYTKGEISIDEVTSYTESANTAFSFPELKKYDGYAESVAGSHDAFSEGKLAEEEGRLGDAVLAYNRVGGAHPNFNEAKDKAADLVGKFKTYIDESLPVWREAADFRTAVPELRAAVELFGDEAYKAAYDEFWAMQYNYDKETYQASQKLAVYDEGLLEVSGGVIVITPVRNLSDFTIKEYTVAFCAYDGKKRTDIATAEKPGDKVSYIQCKNQTAVLAPGATTGDEFGWSISRDTAKRINKIEACVVSATYENGEVWENPYFDYWCTEHDIIREVGDR